MKESSIKFDHLTLGVCYYPEHWEKKLWKDDLKRMKEYGIEVIRIAEFAWNKFEPEDGVFTFDFFDEFMDLVKESSMKVIFCTPTATPPIWLSEKYPEILNADIDGNLYYHGTRRHYNMNSPVYRSYSARITQKLAEHYCNHPSIIGWQLDNEINCENDLYYSECDHKAFRRHCKEKYETLENFNDKMGTIFWNQTYNDWEEVHLTRRTNTYGITNPHLQLEEQKFISETVISYFKLQADIIREYQNKCGRTDQFITTNGLFRYIDYQKLVDGILDFITFDNYPAFAFEKDLEPGKTNGMKDRNASYNLVRTRSISENFGIMEQQSGAGGWNCRMLMPMPKPGQMRLWALQDVAHGADFISFFRWRTARVGTEIYWHGLHDYDNRKNRRITELEQLSSDVKKLGNIVGAKVVKQVAVFMDYENDWDGVHDIWHGPLDEKSRDSWFCVLEKMHIPFDFVFLNEKSCPEDLKDYQAVIYPHPTILTEKRSSLLKAYIKQGGQVVFGCRTGYKDEYGRCYEMPMPGYAAELCGCYVKEYTMVSSFDIPLQISANGRKADAPLFHDVLEPLEGGEVMGTFSQEQNTDILSHYLTEPAIVRKKLGEGYGWYVGSAFAENTAKMLLELLGITKNAYVGDSMEIPEEVELVIREKEGEFYAFLINYEPKPVQVHLKEEYEEILTQKKVSGMVEIEKYDCMILKFSV